MIKRFETSAGPDLDAWERDFNTHMSVWKRANGAARDRTEDILTKQLAEIWIASDKDKRQCILEKMKAVLHRLSLLQAEIWSHLFECIMMRLPEPDTVAKERQ